LKEIYLNYNQITEMNWEGCPEGLKQIYFHDYPIAVLNWKGCPEGLKFYENKYDESFLKYKKTKEFLDFKTKPLRDINAEISANSVLAPDSKVKAFNVVGYKENFYSMMSEMKAITGWQ
jgi:hypothetical protein